MRGVNDGALGGAGGDKGGRGIGHRGVGAWGGEQCGGVRQGV